MNIVGIHVDGYGILSDLTIDDLAPGLTVIYGPNEAGKSTLLDFVRGVLFGFPTRRQRQAYREPLRGGRHGGTIRFIDDGARTWTLTRYVGARQPELYDQNGALVSNEEIVRLLGGADDALFSSVFAFGLNELASLETLENDEVRELVFSAGVLGAGRSATQAARVLEARQAQIVRPRQHDAIANQLRRRLEENRDTLRVARARAQRFPALQAEYERMAADVRDMRATSEEIRRRIGELDRLITYWPVWKRKLDAQQRLSSLANEQDDTNPISGLEPAIRQLSGDLSGHLERRHQLANLERQMAGIERDLSSLLEDLGGDIDTDAILAMDAGLATRDRIANLAATHRDLRSGLNHLEVVAQGARSELERAEEALEAVSAAQAVRSGEELAKLSSTLFELRQRVAERDAAQLDEARAHAGEPSRGFSPHGAAPLILGGALGALSMVLAVLFGYRRDLVVAVVFVLAGVFAVAVGAWIALRSPTRLSDLHGGTREAHDDSSSSGDAIATLAHRVDPSLRPNAAEVEIFTQRLEQERLQRRQIDEAAREVARAQRRFDSAMDRLTDGRTQIAACETALARESTLLGFAKTLSPTGLESAVDTLKTTQDRIEARARVRGELDVLRSSIAAFDNRLFTLCRDASLDDASSLEEGDAVALLESTLEKALDKAQLCRELNQLIAGADEDLDEAFGSGPDAARMRAELARGAVFDWGEQRQRLLDELNDAQPRYEEQLGAQRDAKRDLGELLGSDEIATLEFEHGALNSALDAALIDWAVLGVAQELLERTLGRYERDRQPIVIARAGALFREVTKGRYVQIVARESDDGGRSHGIQAITESGAHLDAGDLSRGTAEQLYICLRLAFATTFAERAIALPLVLDDVLVNFDPDRAQAIAHAIAATATGHQVLAFTCHPHVVEYFEHAHDDLKVIELYRAP